MEPLKHTLKVLIPVFSNSTQGKKISLMEGNPGIGGTEYNAIVLAISLAKKCSEWLIVLVNKTEIDLGDSPRNLVQETFESESLFLECIEPESHSLLILTASFANRVDPNLIKKFENRYICWSHHPFDIKTKRIVSQVNPSCVVCVGTYQYYSNKNISSNIHHIQNIFIPPIQASQKRDHLLNKQKLKIVHLGALVPGKGFLEIAKSWKKLKVHFPDLTLHVIGSSGTYGGKTECDLIPTSAEYAKQILRYIPKEDINTKKVIFYGNLGENKFEIIQKCDLAIQNPTGATEAFPASPLECMSFGLPVIASSDFGMSDCMRFFPELAVTNHKDIVEKVSLLVSDPLRYNEFCQRALAVSAWFASQNDLIIVRWTILIQLLMETSSNSFKLAPIMPFYGSKLTLVARRDIRPALSIVKSFIFKAFIF